MQKEKLAECVGLWLAEGNNKCNNEITFTNSSKELIQHFHRIVSLLFPNARIRIYTYSTSGKADAPVSASVVRNYVDKRARRPYFIWQLASVEAMQVWKNIVSGILGDCSVYPYILRGFFAGEGSVKTGKHKNRVLRIAQKQRKDFIDRILNYLGITFVFRPKNRSYEMTGKWNWDIFHKFRLAGLHPLKQTKFQQVYNSYKQEHYPVNELRNKILGRLVIPHTSSELSRIFKRSQARIAEILVNLKKSRIVNNFRVRSTDYWILASMRFIVLSKVKERYLNLLSEKPQTAAVIAKHIAVDYKCAQKRLQELAKLALVERDEDKMWKLMPTRSKIIFI